MTLAESFTNVKSTWTIDEEWFIAANSATKSLQTTDGVYQLWVDMSALDRGDRWELRAYEKVRSGSTEVEVFRAYIEGQPSASTGSRIYVTPPMMLLHGWDFSLIQRTATDRQIDWAIRGDTGSVSEAFNNTKSTWTQDEVWYLAANSATKSLQTTAGFYQLFLDLTAMAKADEWTCRCHNEVRDAVSTDRVVFKHLLAGDFGTGGTFFSMLPFVGGGWDFSLEQETATDRQLDWSIRKVG